MAYESNYCAGLRVLDVTGIADAAIIEVCVLTQHLVHTRTHTHTHTHTHTRTHTQIGFFDMAPDCDSPGFHGAWSSYPYFKSGTIVVSSIERGLFVLRDTSRD